MMKTKLPPFVVSFENSEEFHHLKREIWGGHCYYSELESHQPYIIDVGAHIGLATLYFAKNYPTAQILSLEPNPLTFKILEENIWQNRLENRVEVRQVALSLQPGQQKFWHLATAKDWQLNAGLNEKTWKNTKLDQNTMVETVTLASLLTRKVDLLKLDIEGSEQAVLTQAAERLKLINHLLIEFHPTADQTLATILALLTKAGFAWSLWKNGQQIEQTQAKGLVLIQAKN